MKKALIAYASKSGSTRRAAEQLAHALAPGCDLYDLRAGVLHTLSGTKTRLPVKKLDFAAYSSIALGSAMYMGKPLAPFLRVCKAEEEALTARPLFLFTCGLASQSEEQSYLWPQLSQALTAHAGELHHLGGELRAEGGFLQRMVLKDYEKKNEKLPSLDESAIARLIEQLKQ